MATFARGGWAALALSGALSWTAPFAALAAGDPLASEKAQIAGLLSEIEAQAASRCEDSDLAASMKARLDVLSAKSRRPDLDEAESLRRSMLRASFLQVRMALIAGSLENGGGACPARLREEALRIRKLVQVDVASLGREPRAR